MRIEFLKSMKCPYCNGDLNIEKIVEVKKNNIINGCLKCQCNRYPVIDSILILKIDLLKERTIELINQGDCQSALALFLLSPAQSFCFRIAKYFKYKRPYGDVISKCIQSFLQQFASHNQIKYKKEHIDYCSLQHNRFLKHRFSVQTIWSIYPLFPLLKRKGGKLLNLCCGNGHLSFMISRCVAPEEQICVDNDFCSLYLAKKYFVPDATFVCFDVNYPLPFKENIFSSIVCSDAFPFINSKALLSNELDRVLKNTGIIIISHLRNSLIFNSTMGVNIPKLTPRTWCSFFNNRFKISIIPEKKLVDDFLNNTIDLSNKYSEQMLNSSDPITVIASRDDSIFTTYNKINDIFLINKNNLIINPIYDVLFGDDEVILEKHHISDYFSELYPVSEDVLPKRCIIDLSIVKYNSRKIKYEAEMSDEMIKYIEDLMKKLIIINVPLKYTSEFELKGGK